mgnify:CR=1 FL=1
MPYNKNITATIANEIQSGDVTPHQDRSIVPVSLSTKNTTNNTNSKLNPTDVFDSLIFNLFNSYINI